MSARSHFHTLGTIRPIKVAANSSRSPRGKISFQYLAFPRFQDPRITVNWLQDFLPISQTDFLASGDMLCWCSSWYQMFPESLTPSRRLSKLGLQTATALPHDPYLAARILLTLLSPLSDHIEPHDNQTSLGLVRWTRATSHNPAPKEALCGRPVPRI